MKHRTYGWILALSSLFTTFAWSRESPYEYKEMDFRIGAGWETVRKAPGKVDDAYSISGHITYFLIPMLAIDTYYAYTAFDETLQRAGGGPLLRPLDLSYLRAEVEAHATYARVFDGNHAGWGASVNLHFPFRALSWIPFVGPYVSYERTYLPGEDLSTLGFGLVLALTGKTDFN